VKPKFEVTGYSCGLALRVTYSVDNGDVYLEDITIEDVDKPVSVFDLDPLELEDFAERLASDDHDERTHTHGEEFDPEKDM